MSAKTLFVAASIAAFSASSLAAKVAPEIARVTRTSGMADIMVTFTNTDIEALQGDNVIEAEQVQSALIEAANQKHAALNELLESQTVPVNSQKFWINGAVSIKGASADLIKKISALPNVATIRKSLVIPAPVVHAEPAGDAQANEWGVEIIQAPSVWANGNNGKNVVVSSIDTGVRATHESLKATWRADKGWFDPYPTKSKTPDDGHGHGTHTMGSIVGSTGIGVAPGASWISCRGCTSSGCTEEALLGCGQFILCPTDADGKNADCKKAPAVVNNSWGATQYDDFYEDVVKAWRKAGIVPVFSNGNSGPSCGTVGSPGDYPDVIGVGATGADDKLAYFSSKGPTSTKVLKPDVSAPGYKIRSAKNTGDTEYQVMSGTSMSAPHVTGAVALIKSANPSATYDDVYQLLTSSVDTATLTPENLSCDGKNDTQYPNNNYGFGRINLIKALPY